MNSPNDNIFKNISEYPDSWDIAQAMQSGKPIFLRYRVGLKDAVAHPGYPFQIGVAVPFLDADSDGLPANEEGERLGIYEDALTEALSAHGAIALVITTNGMREYIFYMSKWEPQEYERIVMSVPAGEYKPQFMMQSDPAWETFKQYSTWS